MTELLAESFDSQPYVTELVRKDGSFNYQFTADDGEVYRAQFYPSNGLGPNVRRVYLGHKKGSIYKDVMTRLQDPMRIVATMLAAFAEFQATPTGKSTDGFVIDATVKAFGPTIRIMKRLAARNPIIRTKFNLLDTNYTWDASRSPIWIYRKGTDPQAVFSGKNVDVSALVGGKPVPHKLAPEAPVVPAPAGKINTAPAVGGVPAPASKARAVPAPDASVGAPIMYDESVIRRKDQGFLSSDDGKQLINGTAVRIKVGETYQGVPNAAVFYEAGVARMATDPKGKIFRVLVVNATPNSQNDNYVEGPAMLVKNDNGAPAFSFDERMEFARSVILAEKNKSPSRYPTAEDVPGNAIFDRLPKPGVPVSGAQTKKAIDFAIRVVRESTLGRYEMLAVLLRLKVPPVAQKVAPPPAQKPAAPVSAPKPAPAPAPTKVSSGLTTSALTDLRTKWAAAYDGHLYGEIEVNVDEVHAGEQFSVFWEMTERRTTQRTMFNNNLSDVNSANAMLSQLNGIARTLGFVTTLHLCDESSIGESEAFAVSDGRSDYRDTEQTIGGDLIVSLK